MTTRLFLVRHGATTLSAEDRFAGSTDTPLSEEGRQQAASLARRLKDDTLAAVYCSPMRRTLETASHIAGSPGVPPVTRPGLREIDHGHWEGLRRQEVESQFHDEYLRWEEDPVTVAPAGGGGGGGGGGRALAAIPAVSAWHGG